MASADRLLDLLALLGARRHWGADELADRLEVTERTVRRDIARLREIGYSVESEPGRHGGYRLASGDRLPPLVLDDEEAMVMAVGLGAITSTGAPGMTDAAVSALVKLDRILPARLRERAAALRSVTLGLTGLSVPAVDTDALVTVALACERPERLRFEYRDAAERHSVRWVEPYRLVFTSMQWYLVARDLDRDDWRTFRIDRMSELVASGVPFERGEVTDALAQVAAGVAVHAYPTAVSVRFDTTLERVESMIPRTVGVVDHADDRGVVVRIGGDVDWIARYLLQFSTPFEVLDSPELVAELRRIGEELVRAHS